MKSPFPGMDPYMEGSGLWPDFHTKLIGEIERHLADQLPQGYFVQTGERSYIVLAGTDGKEEYPVLPDVGIHSQGEPWRPPTDSSGGTAVAVAEPATATDGGPVTMRAFVEEHQRESFIEIREATEDGPRLVTCIEVLSPANKRRGEQGRDLYLRKRNGLMLGGVHLVEIDLLRGGHRMPMVEPWPKSPYYLLVARASRAPYCRVWPAHFDRPLPEIPVPLVPPAADLTLVLQPMVDAVYQRSRYSQRFDYRQPATPPLPPEQAAWLATRLETPPAQPGG